MFNSIVLEDRLGTPLTSEIRFGLAIPLGRDGPTGLFIEPDGFPTIIEAARQGDHGALTTLFRAYQPMLIRYLRAQDREAADDVASEVWVAAARRMRWFTGDEAGFRRWLFTIARRRLIDHRRAEARRHSQTLVVEALDPTAITGEWADPAVVVARRSSAQATVDRLVTQLPPDQAEVVLLRVLGGFDVAEVAEIMDRSPGSVRVLCHRALRRLATQFPREVLVE
jgi:RNA polymerase sigma-70 factor (ECF subfamily)